jgi:O6-methylguanine-DNA--protein-cysteine methyltransferase
MNTKPIVPRPITLHHLAKKPKLYPFREYDNGLFLLFDRSKGDMELLDKAKRFLDEAPTTKEHKKTARMLRKIIDYIEATAEPFTDIPSPEPDFVFLGMQALYKKADTAREVKRLREEERKRGRVTEGNAHA